MTRGAVQSQGAWSRFARAVRSKAGSRWAWRALLACMGLAVLAPWIANERPYFARFRDTKGYADALAMIVPISEAIAREAKANGPGLAAEVSALHARLDVIGAGLGRDGNEPARREWTAFALQVAGFDSTMDANDRTRLCDELRGRAPGMVTLLAPLGAGLAARTSWPLFASLSMLDIAALCAWLGLATMGLWSRRVPELGIRARVFALVVFALAIGGASQLLPHSPATLDAGAWKARIAADGDSTAVFAPIAFGPSETNLERPLEGPLAGNDGSGRHWCGTDQLGRDLLSRMLYASRTSFAVAFLAALLIVTIGSLLGLAAGALRGFVDGVVLRAIELLQAFPTLVLLLGLVALLPVNVANSRWTMPLCIAAFGWTHIARLARAEALRVSEMGFVQAAVAAGFTRRHVILRHVLPNSLGPVWIAASFVLSAGLVLESAAAFLGFGIQLPAPSFGALLADARATHAWWLALFPGLWLFASILAIHLVGEGVRDALDPRDEGGPR